MRSEAKLKKLEKNSNRSANAKEIISSMSQFNEAFMHNAFKNGISLNSDGEMTLTPLDVSYLKVNLDKL